MAVTCMATRSAAAVRRNAHVHDDRRDNARGRDNQGNYKRGHKENSHDDHGRRA